MDEPTDPLANLDFTPTCNWHENAPSRCTHRAHFGYRYSCGCAALMCGEHDARMRRVYHVACPKHGAVTAAERTVLAVTS